MAVVAVTSAVMAGQQHALEARQRIAANLAAEELLSRLLTVDYNNLPAWNGYTENVGTMTNVLGQPLPESFATIGRVVEITTSLQSFDDLGVRVLGRTIRVRAFNAEPRFLADVSRFVPEPQP